MDHKLKMTVAIVGSGASGVTCFIQLVLKYIITKPSKILSIILFEKKGEFGTGLAYGTGQEGHLLNTKAGLMGLFPQERLHFVRWMHDHKDRIEQEFPQVSPHPDAYPPRMLYGKYVQAMLDEYWQLARQKGIEVSKQQVEIVDAEVQKDKRVILRSASDHSYLVDYVILATGTPEAATFENLKGLERYIGSPWPSKRIIQTIQDKYAKISIVGSSLTAIDALITLVANGHKGPITFFSLRGLLPRVQSASEKPFQRKVLTLSTIKTLIRENRRSLRVKDLIRLFRSEVEGYLERKLDWATEERVNKNHLQLLEEDIRQAMNGDSLFQNILYSLREETYAIWKLLPVDQKILFVKWIKPYFDINRHAVPMENGIKIMNLLKSNQLEVIGNSEDIKWKGNKFVLKTEDGHTYEADFVINASGPASVIHKMEDQKLLQALLSKKYIQEYGAGGLIVDLNTLRVKDVSSEERTPFYALGHPITGLQLDVNSLWFNVEQADLLTDDLIRQFQ
ncbi:MULTISPECIES: FAD/NAD(P)-binding protein [Olivibacter]|uniref:FAD/NAD(P)-binding protein n=1 Tax=Olivibacter jilunii TaxID=985016 RepID=A0ABW6B4P9_9SPHI